MMISTYNMSDNVDALLKVLPEGDVMNAVDAEFFTNQMADETVHKVNQTVAIIPGLAYPISGDTLAAIRAAA